MGNEPPAYRHPVTSESEPIICTTAEILFGAKQQKFVRTWVSSETPKELKHIINNCPEKLRQWLNLEIIALSNKFVMDLERDIAAGIFE